MAHRPTTSEPTFQSEYFPNLSEQDLAYPQTGVVVIRSKRDPNRDRRGLDKFRGHFAPGKAQTARTAVELKTLQAQDPEAGVWKFDITPEAGDELWNLFMDERNQPRPTADADRAALVSLMDRMVRFVFDTGLDEEYITPSTDLIRDVWHLFKPWIYTYCKNEGVQISHSGYMENTRLDALERLIGKTLTAEPKVPVFMRMYFRYCVDAYLQSKAGQAPAPRELARAGHETRLQLGVIPVERVPNKTRIMATLTPPGKEEPTRLETQFVAPLDPETPAADTPADQSAWLSGPPDSFLGMDSGPGTGDPSGIRVRGLEIPEELAPRPDATQKIEEDFFNE